MASLFNLARVTTTTTGTGTITLGSAVSGYLTFALAGVADGQIVSYGIKDGANSEVGTGTYTASGTTLTRTVTKSTNSDAAISLSGSAEVYITARAQDISVGTYSVRGADCANNSSTPNTQFDLDADEIVLINSSGQAVRVTAPGAAITCNISTAGPAANGRDQAGALSNSSWAHFYWIYNGSTLATTVSATAPPTGPTLPGGYTHWAYAGPVRVDGSGNLLRVRIKGNRAYYGTQDTTRPTVLAGGSATSETAVDVSAAVPPNAASFWLGVITWQITTDGSGVAAANIVFRVASGINYLAINMAQSGLANSSTDRLDTGAAMEMPNVGQNFYYIWTVTNGSSPSVAAAVYSYSIPNGG